MIDNRDSGGVKGGGSFTCPRITQFAPNAYFQWITFTARELKVSHSYGGLPNVVETGAVLGTFTFLLPEEFSEQVTHSWSEIDNIAGDIATKVTETYQKAMNVTALGDGISKYAENQNDRASAAQVISNIGHASKQQQAKVDGALVYTDSTKRDYNFTFELVNQGDPILDVLGPIKTLMSLSCARQMDALKIDFPSVFQITTANGLVNVENAALTSVQATYKGGYDKNGFPMAAELTLSFNEIEPLYRHRVNMAKAGVVTVGPNTQTAERDFKGYRESVQAKVEEVNAKYNGRRL